jgi:predicted RNA binding protein YcfA (HicA-like mRNA interferase family)
MAFDKHVWNQLKNKTADDLISALERDGYEKDPATHDATIAYIKRGSPNKRVVIHYHPRKTYGPKFLQALIRDIGWAEDDLKRLGLIKGRLLREDSYEPETCCICHQPVEPGQETVEHKENHLTVHKECHERVFGL